MKSLYKYALTGIGMDSFRIKAKPFPGRWPTRWRIGIFNAKGGRVFDMITKPNAETRNRILRLARHPRFNGGTISLVEFDKLGAFRCSIQHLPRTSFRISAAAGSISRFYYPWHETGADFFAPIARLHTLRMLFNGRAFCIYSPYEAMVGEDKIELLRGYRTWLRKTNLFQQ